MLHVPYCQSLHSRGKVPETLLEADEKYDRKWHRLKSYSKSYVELRGAETLVKSRI